MFNITTSNEKKCMEELLNNTFETIILFFIREKILMAEKQHFIDRQDTYFEVSKFVIGKLQFINRYKTHFFLSKLDSILYYNIETKDTFPWYK